MKNILVLTVGLLLIFDGFSQSNNNINEKYFNKNSFNFYSGYSRSDYNSYSEYVVDYVFYDTISETGISLINDTILASTPKANGLHLGVNYNRHFNSYGGVQFTYFNAKKRIELLGTTTNSYDFEASYQFRGWTANDDTKLFASNSSQLTYLLPLKIEQLNLGFFIDL